MKNQPPLEGLGTGGQGGMSGCTVTEAEAEAEADAEAGFWITLRKTDAPPHTSPCVLYTACGRSNNKHEHKHEHEHEPAQTREEDENSTAQYIPAAVPAPFLGFRRAGSLRSRHSPGGGRVCRLPPVVSSVSSASRRCRADEPIKAGSSLGIPIIPREPKGGL